MPFLVKGSDGRRLDSTETEPVKFVVSTLKTRHESPRTPFSLIAYNGIKPQRSPSFVNRGTAPLFFQIDIPFFP
uniref:Uncharacterized protein n=1 Tax=uncultured marine group II/III euryarchaeote KM3_134_C10 TaxID=1457865 RepID=A0A075GFU4_9EURY|nr:hypothetical protein [uncultured marine group II/III euryarchaeote KM3_134_C10]